MLDIKFIRENLDVCKTAAVNKNRVVEWERLLTADEKRKEFIGKIDALRTERNVVSKERTDASAVRGKEIKNELKALEESLRTIEVEFEAFMLTVPNVPDKSVPIGKDEKDNVEVKRWGNLKNLLLFQKIILSWLLNLI